MTQITQIYTKENICVNLRHLRGNCRFIETRQASPR
jgi:hypothetical protein